MRKFILAVSISLFSLVNAQNELASMLEDSVDTDKEYVSATFKTTRLVNLTTIEQVKRGELDFRIAHRFSDMLGTNGAEKNLFGLDGISDIRFSFDYGLSDRWQIGIGRSKGAYTMRQIYDLNTKCKILIQNRDVPVSLSFFGMLTYTTQESNGLASSIANYSKTPYRLNYFGQFLIARKFSPNFSAIIAPSIIQRNLVDLGDNNMQFALGLGLRYKVSRRVALIADYYQLLNTSSYQKATNYIPPIGLGIEIETGGHVFHVVLSNTRGLTEPQFITNEYQDPSNKIGMLRLGFNISRVFTILHAK